MRANAKENLQATHLNIKEHRDVQENPKYSYHWKNMNRSTDTLGYLSQGAEHPGLPDQCDKNCDILVTNKTAAVQYMSYHINDHARLVSFL
jgi:hypothetical protein